MYFKKGFITNYIFKKLQLKNTTAASSDDTSALLFIPFSLKLTRPTTSAIPRNSELDEPSEHAHHTRNLLLAMHGERIRNVALEVQGDTLWHEGQNGHEVVVLGSATQFVAKRLDEPGAFRGVAPGIVTWKRVSNIHIFFMLLFFQFVILESLNKQS